MSEQENGPVVHDCGWVTYLNPEQNLEVEVHKIAGYELRLVGEFFNVGIFKEGDYLIKWPDGHCTVVTPEIFALRYKKKETAGEDEGEAFDLDDTTVTSKIADALLERLTEEEVRSMASQHRYVHPSIFPLSAGSTGSPGRVYWASVDDARSFAMEMQYAIDHPEEQSEGRQFSEDEIREAKEYIRSAKRYLADHDESLELCSRTRQTRLSEYKKPLSSERLVASYNCCRQGGGAS